MSHPKFVTEITTMHILVGRDLSIGFSAS